MSETSAVHGCRSQTPSTDLPFERRTQVSGENTSGPKPNQIQSFWGDRSGFDVSRERGNSAGESGEFGVALAPPPLAPPKPKTALPPSQSPTPSLQPSSSTATGTRRSLARSQSGSGSNTLSSTANNSTSSSSARPAKKAKTSASSSSSGLSTGIQMSMNMFLTARPAKEESKKLQPVVESTPAPQPSPSPSTAVASALDEANTASAAENEAAAAASEWMTAEEVDAAFRNLDAAKASWSRLGLGQRQGPLCEHGEPCKTFVTKKAGVNSGRSFYMCARPPGPLGKKEKGTAWQCTTFVWCRDWRPERES